MKKLSYTLMALGIILNSNISKAQDSSPKKVKVQEKKTEASTPAYTDEEIRKMKLANSTYANDGNKSSTPYMSEPQGGPVELKKKTLVTPATIAVDPK